MNAARHDLGASAGGAGPGAGAARAPGGSGAGREEATHKARLHVSLPGAGARAGKRTRPLHEGYVRLASYPYVCLRRVRRRVVPQCGNAPCVGGTSAPRFVFRTLPCAHLRPPSALDAHVARIAHLIVIRDAGARDVPTGARGRPPTHVPQAG